MAVLQGTLNAKNQTKPRETMTSKEKTSTKPAKKVLLIAQDVKFAKALACNEKKLRDRALKRLKKWFQQRLTTHPFSEDDFMRIWKGLFYSMWMSDKPLIQEECAENISQLVHFPDPDTSLLFFKCGFQTLMQEWFGIDQLRLDKFLMFARRLLRQGFVILKNAGWKKNPVTKFGEVLMESVLKPKAENVLGLKMHFTDIYLEELAKISEGRISPFTVSQLILPFIKHLAVLDDFREITHIKQNVFRYLIRQSDKGIEFDERYEAWKKTGFAGGSIDAIVKQRVPPEERVPSPEPEELREDKPLDPRAGRVNVELPQIRFSSKDIVRMLEEHKFIEGSNPKSRKTITSLIHDFSELTKGKYPLGIKKLVLPKDDNYSMKLKHSVNRLVKFEKKLMGTDKKQRKRKLEVEEEVEVPKKKKKKQMAKKNNSDADFFAKKLENFIAKSERKLITPKKLKKPKIQEDPDDVVNSKTVFRRNSGVWYVSEQTDERPSTSSPQVADNVPKMSEKVNNGVSVENIQDPESDEDIQDEEEEYEIFIPSRRRKLKEINEKLKQDVVENPFSKPATPASVKKVKIALNLNQSQEIHEHHMQILKSPGIPFDVNKKPSKPLLKPSPVSSPINPFYNSRKKKLFGTSF